jgi:hypothetical protein
VDSSTVSGLLGTLLGAAIGLCSSWFLHARENHQRNEAVRVQILALLRVVEQRMLSVRDYGGIPLEGWVYIDRLVVCVFAIDAARGLWSSDAHERVYDAVIEVQQIRGVVDYIGETQRELRERSGSAQEQAGDWQKAQTRIEELKAAGSRAVVVLRDARHALGDYAEVRPQIDPESAKEQLS